MTDAPAPEIQPTALVLDLSGEELSYLLHMLGVAEIPGFVAAAESDDLIDTVVRHSLAARGAIARNIDGDWRVSEIVNATVTAGLRAERFLTVRRDSDAGIEEAWLYVLPSVVVQYSRPAEYVHRFVAIFTPEALVESLVGLLELNDAEAVAPARLTYPAQIFEVRRLAREGRFAEADQTAAALHLPEDLHAALAASLQYAAFSASAVRGSRAVTTGGMAVASAETGVYWLLTPDGPDVIAERSDASEVVRRIGDLLQP